MSFRPLLFRSLWTNGYNLPAALRDIDLERFDGIEGPVPADTFARRDFVTRLRERAVPFIAEITTGGSYVPSTRDLENHLEDFQRKAEQARAAQPMFLTVLGGCDAWPIGLSVDFFSRALEIARQLGLIASFETHRSRSTFNPWATVELLDRVPDLRLTCDFSHWCCVCERLVLNDEPEILERCAQRAHHFHARVGYDQGPQVPDPRAPAYGQALASHETWWEKIWEAQKRAGRAFTTLTPEFGPDGYLHTLPFSETPIADLDDINLWMGHRQRAHFIAWNERSEGVSAA